MERTIRAIWVICAVVVMAGCDPFLRESRRMAEAFEQGRQVYGEGENDTLLFIPELDKASAYYAHKKDYGKAALAALYYGYSEKDYDKTLAMDAFKEAERYGALVGDSLTMARAEYQMGKMLYEDYIYHEALDMLEKADANFGQRYVERAFSLNMVACCYLLLQEYNVADSCLNQSLVYAELGNSEEARSKALNNYAILYKLQGEYDKAIDCLKEVRPINTQQTVLNQLNLGDIYLAMGILDSATFYYHLVAQGIVSNEVTDLKKVAAYKSLSVFEEGQGNWSLAMGYRKKYEETLEKLWIQREQKSIYRIQQQYDYESLKNSLDRKIANRQRVIMVACVILLLLSIAFALSQIKLARQRKQEAETNEAMFHFMRQNKDLMQSNDIFARDMSASLEKERKTMMLMHIYLQEPNDKSVLKLLEKTVFDHKDHWDALLDVVEKTYPNLWETQHAMFPDLDEDEQKVLLLSRFNLSRQEEASMLNTSVHMVDKLRSRMREKTGQKTKKSKKNLE